MILVTGSTGFLGKRVCRLLKLKAIPHLGISRQNGPDLRDSRATINFLMKNAQVK